MVAMRALVIVGKEREIKIPAMVHGFAALEMAEGAGRHGDRRESGRAAQAFLRATVSDINPGFVDFDGHGTERSHALGDHDSINLVGCITNGFTFLKCTG